jgi:ribosome-associated heat shock protein Hsp15
MLETPALRVDKLLWHLRLVKSRTLAQSWIAQGHMRVNGKRIEHSHTLIRVGDVITLSRGDEVLTVVLDQIPDRRGPANEAKKCYSVLTAQSIR